MSIWIPAVKLILPHVGSIVAAAIPAFTRRQSTTGQPTPPQELQQQIAELQAASTQNAERIRELATQLQETLEALQASALSARENLARARLMSALALALSAGACGFSLFAFYAA